MAMAMAGWAWRVVAVCVVVAVVVARPHPPAQDSASSDILEVVIVPHTHLDVGWLETFDSYYYLNVSKILPGVIANLKADPTKRFSWAEVAYLKKWIDTENPDLTDLKALVANGQFEFVDGGLVQHDQACPSYLQIIEQMTDGQRFLRDHFGPESRPTIGWSIDPFGSSASNAAMYALMGFNALVINRIPDSVMTTLKETQSLEFVWEPSASLSAAESQMFTHVFDSYFCMPSGFRWGMKVRQVDPAINATSVATRARVLAKALLPRRPWFRTNKLLVPWGCDFMYQNASIVFENTDRLMAYVNKNQAELGYNMTYSTPTEYFGSLRDMNMTWPRRGKADFFPLVYEKKGEPQSWTGFYTSRPKLKALSRRATSAIRSAEVLLAWSRLATAATSPSDDAVLVQARLNAAIVLHHDAITGTACAGTEGCTGGLDQVGGDHNVVSDYNERAQSAIDTASAIAGGAISVLVTGRAGGMVPISDPQFAIQGQRRARVPVAVFNPTGQPLKDFPVKLRIPVWTATVHLAEDDSVLPSTVTSQNVYHTEGAFGAGGDAHRFLFELVFKVDLPALGYIVVEIDMSQGPPQNQPATPKLSPAGPNTVQTYTLENSFIAVEADNATGILSVTDKATGITRPFLHELRAYESAADGAYLLNVSNPTSTPLSSDGLLSATLVSNDLYDALYLQYSEQHSILARVYKTANPIVGLSLEVEYHLGVVNPGTEIIASVTSDLAATGALFTDNNAFESLHRTPNHTLTLPENSWPIVGSAYLRDADTQLNIVASQTHTLIAAADGGLGKPAVQVLLHRRGRQQGLSTAVVLDDTTRHFETIAYSVGPVAEGERLRVGLLELRADNPSDNLFMALRGALVAEGATTGSLCGRGAGLPENIRLLSLAQDPTTGVYNARLHHRFTADAAAPEKSPVSLNVTTLFSGHGTAVPHPAPFFKSAVEFSLSLTEPETEVPKRWTWRAAAADRTHAEQRPSPAGGEGAGMVTINPLQIRTFQLQAQ